MNSTSFMKICLFAQAALFFGAGITFVYWIIGALALASVLTVGASLVMALKAPALYKINTLSVDLTMLVAIAVTLVGAVMAGFYITFILLVLNLVLQGFLILILNAKSN